MAAIVLTRNMQLASKSPSNQLIWVARKNYVMFVEVLPILI